MQSTGLDSKVVVVNKSLHTPCPHTAYSPVGTFIEYLQGTEYGAENLTYVISFDLYKTHMT